MIPSPPLAIERPEGPGDFLHIDWTPLTQCNLNCPYCFYAGTTRDLGADFQTTQSFFEKVLAHYQHKKHILVSCSGGEATIWPRFEEMCLWLRSKGVLLGMTSNGVIRDLAFWKRMAPLFHNLALSAHLGGTDTDHIERLLETVCHDTQASLRIMMRPESAHWNDAIMLGERVMANVRIAPVFVEWCPLRSNTDTTELLKYSEEQLHFFSQRTPFIRSVNRQDPPAFEFWTHVLVRENGERSSLVNDMHQLISFGQNAFKGWLCDIGLENLKVYPDGTIWGGTCREGKLIGNVKDDVIVFPKAPVMCQRSMCSCSTDIQICKTKPT